MGRSVDYLTGAVERSYLSMDSMDEWEWYDFMEDLTNTLESMFPSMDRVERWDGSETRIFLANTMAEVGISEYCGMVSLSIRANQRTDHLTEAFMEAWCSKVWPSVDKMLAKHYPGSVCVPMGTFSNGETVYRRAS